MSKKGDFLVGIFIGSILGAAAGLLLAPSTGEETRVQLMEKGKEWKDIATEKALILSLIHISSRRLPEYQRAADRIPCSLSLIHI